MTTPPPLVRTPDEARSLLADALTLTRDLLVEDLPAAQARVAEHPDLLPLLEVLAIDVANAWRTANGGTVEAVLAVEQAIADVGGTPDDAIVGLRCDLLRSVADGVH